MSHNIKATSRAGMTINAGTDTTVVANSYMEAKKLTPQNFDKMAARVIDSLKSIVCSAHCREYQIGYTSRALRARFVEHLRYDNYTKTAVLESNLSFSDALDLEYQLQRRIKKGDKRYAEYRKYNAVARSDYNRRAGTKKGDNRQNTHSVYMVWR